MAGHSKWANIQHRKGRQDKIRGKLFSKLSKEITIASKMGGPDPDANPRLRLAIANAKGQSMPKDNIQRAVDKGQGGQGDDYVDIRYEGFGPGGIGVIVEVSTDNKNRAAAEVRTAFSKNGGNLGETGSVAFMFDQVGEVRFAPEIGDADTVMEAAIEAGADDVESDEDGHVIYTARDDFGAVAKALEERFGEPQSANMIWKPQNTIDIAGDQASTLIKMIDALEDSDDVQKVYANFEISEDEMEKLGA